jgi:hypothetical protein
MVNKNKIHTLCYFNFDQRKLCVPGLYFLYNLGELIYIGISRLPAFRVLQHYYTTDAPKKGIGPIFDQFRVIVLNKTYKDERILQHYEKRWIRKFNPKLNTHTKNVFYDLSIKDIKYHIDTYEQYFKGHMGWHRYINDLVIKKNEIYKKHKRERKKTYENKFA